MMWVCVSSLMDGLSIERKIHVNNDEIINISNRDHKDLYKK